MSITDATRKANFRALKRAARTLNDHGYLIVQNLHHDGPYDIVGIRADRIVLLRVKVIQRGPLPSMDKLIDSLRQFRTPASTTILLWVWERKAGFHYWTVSGREAF